jgi:DNA polymerase I
MNRPDLRDINVTLVETLEEAHDFLHWLQQRRPILAIDTECTGLKWWTPNFVRLIQFGDGERAYCLGAKEWGQVIVNALTLIRDSNVPVAMHNAKFDQHAIESMGWPTIGWHNVYDTMVMDHLCYPIRSHGLKRMGYRVYGPSATVGESVLKAHFKDHKLGWDTIPITEPCYYAYGGMDTVLTARFAEDLGRELSQRGLLPAFERESTVQKIAYGMESRGLRIDTEYTQQLKDQWAEEMVALRLQLDAWGVANPSSKAQVVQALHLKEDWDPEEFTETGEPKLTKNIMAAMDSQIAPLVLRYKRLVKWSEAYLSHFLNEQGPTGVVHPSIRTLGARTGRMSITAPALQTLPSKEASIRSCILPREGEVLWAADYDAMELRVMAHFSQDPGLVTLFQEGLDPHSYAASVVYDLSYEELVAGQHKGQRSTAKNTVFSRIYGAGAAKIAETAGVPPHQIEEFMRIYDTRFPGVKRFMDSTQDTARYRMLNEGEPYVTTAYGRWLNVEPDSLFKLVNYVVQGTCADLLKDRLVAIDRLGLSECIMIPVHDELIMSIPEGDTEMADEIRQTMEEHERFAVPLTCGLEGPFTNWGGAYGI